MKGEVSVAAVANFFAKGKGPQRPVLQPPAPQKQENFSPYHLKRFTPFAHFRGECQCCEGRCFAFAGAWQPGSSFSQCKECGCQMSEHKLVPPSKKLSRRLWEQVSKKDLSQEGLQFAGRVVAFELDDDEGKRSESERGLLTLLQESGFGVLGLHYMPAVQLVRDLCLSAALRTQICDLKSQHESTLKQFRAFLSEDNFLEKEDPPRFRELVTKIRRRLSRLPKRELLVVMVRDQQPEQCGVAAVIAQCKGAELIWESRGAAEGLADAQVLFGQFFKVNYSRFHVLQNQMAKFKDYLLLNSFVPVDTVPTQPLLRGRTQVVQQVAAQVGPRVSVTMGASAWLEEVEEAQGEGERVALVLRPLLVRQGMDQLVVNIFRLNGFSVVSRSLRRLDEQQVQHLAAWEGLPKQQAYRDMMLFGFSQVILLSKINARFEAELLLSGQPIGIQNFRPRPKNLTVGETREGGQFERKVLRLPQSAFQARHEWAVFSSVRELFSVSRLVLGGSGFPTFLKDKEGRILQLEQDGQAPRRINLRTDLALNSFNFVGVSVSDVEKVNQLVAQLAPREALFQHAVLMLKPAYIEFRLAARELLLKLRFILIGEADVTVTRSLAQQMLPRAKQDSIRHLLGRTVLYEVSKPGGLNQLISLLGASSLGDSTAAPLPELKASDLGKVLVLGEGTLTPIFYKLLSPHLQDLEHRLKQVYALPPQRVRRIEEFIMASVLGTTVSEGRGDVVTPLGKFHIKHDSPAAKVRANYAALIAAQYCQRVPLIFQYRQVGKTLYQVSSYAGLPFFQAIEKMRAELEDREQGLGKGNRSAVLLLWARKLARWLRQVLQLGKVKGYGKAKLGPEGWSAPRLSQDEILTLEERRLAENAAAISKALGSAAAPVKRTADYLLTNHRLRPLFRAENLRMQPSDFRGDSLRIDYSLLNIKHSKLALADYERAREGLPTEGQVFNLDYCAVGSEPVVRSRFMATAEVWLVLELAKEGSPWSAGHLQEQLFRSTAEENELLADSPYACACFLAATSALSREIAKAGNSQGINKKKHQDMVQRLLRVCEQGMPELRVGGPPVGQQQRRRATEHRLASVKPARGVETFDLLGFHERLEPCPLLDQDNRLEREWNDQHYHFNMLRKDPLEGPARREVILRMRSTAPEEGKPEGEEDLSQQAIQREIRKFMEAKQRNFAGD